MNLYRSKEFDTALAAEVYINMMLWILTRRCFDTIAPYFTYMGTDDSRPFCRCFKSIDRYHTWTRRTLNKCIESTNRNNSWKDSNISDRYLIIISILTHFWQAKFKLAKDILNNSCQMHEYLKKNCLSQNFKHVKYMTLK